MAGPAASPEAAPAAEMGLVFFRIGAQPGMTMAGVKEIFQSQSWKNFRDLRLPQKGAPFAGVCSALGSATPLAAWMWRVLFCATTLVWGGGLIAYVILWISIPRQRPD